MSVEPRKCGHAFVLAATCPDCRRYVDDVRATSKTVTVRPTHGTGH